MRAKIARHSLTSLTTVILAVALITLSFRACLYFVPLYQTQITKWLSEKITTPFTLERMSVDWHGIEPTLKLHHVTVESDFNSAPPATIDNITLRFNYVKTLRRLKPVFKLVQVSGLNIDIHTETLSDETTNQNTALIEALSYLANHAEIQLFSSAINITTKDNHYPIKINALSLYKRGTRYDLITTLTGLRTGKAGNNSSLKLVLSTKGDLTAPQQLNTNGYIELAAYPLKSLNIQKWLTADITDGQLNGQIWFKGKGTDNVSMQSVIKLHDLRIEDNESSEYANLSQAKLLVFAEGNTTEWRATISQQLLQVEDVVWPSSQLEAHYQKKDQTHLSLKTDYLNLASLSEIAQFIKPTTIGKTVNQFIQTAKPEGKIHAFALEVNENTLTNLSFDFSELVLLPWDKIPGVTKLSGKLSTDGRWGALALSGEAFTVNFPSLFRAPLTIDALTVPLTWHKTADAITLSAPHITTHLNGGELVTDFYLHQPVDDTSAKIAILTHFDGFNGKHKSAYLPVGIMNDNLVNWLDRSIKDTVIKDGKMILHGNLSDFPFKRHKGTFEITANLHNLHLNYSKTWPEITQANAYARFTGIGMDVMMDRGIIAGYQAHHIVGKIPNYDNGDATLYLNGTLTAPAEHALDLIINSPINRNIGISEGEYTLTGQSTIDLGLIVPLNHADDTKVDGSIRLADATLSIVDTPLVLTAFNGTIDYTESSVDADGMTGQLFGLPAKLSLKTLSTQQPSLTELQLSGQLPANFIHQKTEPGSFNHQIAKRVTGTSPFNAIMQFMDKKDLKPEQPRVRLQVESQLTGIEIGIPSPVGKPKDEPLPVKVRVDYHAEGERIAHIFYGDIFNSTFAWGNLETGEGNTMHGDINLGKTTPQLGLKDHQHSDTLNIQGKLPNVVLAEWIEFLAGIQDDRKTETAEDPWFKQAKLQFTNVDVFGLDFPDLNITASVEPEHWRIHAQNDMIDGDVLLARGYTTSKPIGLTLKKLHLPKMANKTPANKIEMANPSKINDMDILIDELKYQDLTLGALNLKLRNTEKGLTFNNGQLRLPDSTFDFEGLWGTQKTNIQGNMTSTQIGSTLENWDIHAGIKGNNANFSYDLTWSGSPADFSLPNLNGLVSAHIKRGRLIEVSQGASRMMGLLTFQALRRRLTLDFSDIYKRGLSFDHIKGDFRLEAGNAYTCNAELVGPSTNIQIKGRTGLVAKDFDQTATVALDLTGSLPLIVGAFNPIAGAATWIGNKLLENQINRLTQLQYTIEGSWDNPDISVSKTPSVLKPWEIIPSLLEGNKKPKSFKECE